mgnify:CR=1 FL=1
MLVFQFYSRSSQDGSVIASIGALIGFQFYSRSSSASTITPLEPDGAHFQFYSRSSLPYSWLSLGSGLPFNSIVDLPGVEAYAAVGVGDTFNSIVDLRIARYPFYCEIISLLSIL